MKKYLALYIASNAALDDMMKNTTPEQQKQGMSDWMLWMQNHKNNVADMGAPAGKNKRVSTSGVADVRNEVTGYSVVQAESADEAAKLFMDSPHLHIPGAYVEVTELMDIPSM